MYIMGTFLRMPCPITYRRGNAENKVAQIVATTWTP
jgi:hypothetical protein